MPSFDLTELLIIVPAVLLSLSFHEAAHGFVAWKLGDTTAKEQGRLTLNPLKHIDLIGLVCMVLLRFGWAKPVPVNPRNFTNPHLKSPRMGMALVAVAGPVMNLILALVGVFIYYAIVLWLPEKPFWSALAEFFVVVSVLSTGFCVFNLLPLPPLDGSRVLMLVLPKKWAYYLLRYERYIQIALVLLLVTGLLTRPLAAARGFILNGMERFVRWILL